MNRNEFYKYIIHIHTIVTKFHIEVDKKLLSKSYIKVLIFNNNKLFRDIQEACVCICEYK